jgi:hypothetical protein
MVNRQDVIDEQVRMTRLRLRVDLTAFRLRHGNMNRAGALALIERTRDEILELFPDKADVFELVLRPRFMRILDERALAEWGVADSMN